MARRRTYRKKSYSRPTYRARASSYSRRVRGGARKANSVIGVYNPGMAYLAGLGIGALTNIDDKIDARIKIGLACLPLKGGIGGQVKKLAEGICFGDMLQHSLNLPSLAGSAIKGNQLKGFGQA